MQHSHSQNHEPMQSNDYHQLPATEKQLKYARFLSQKKGIVLPLEAQQDRRSLSDWNDAQKSARTITSQFDNYPSSKQVQFAERIARYKRSEVPHECFRDKGLMSRWIDCNK